MENVLKLMRLHFLTEFFEAALKRIPKQGSLSDQDLPRPDCPKHDEIDPTKIDTDEDQLCDVWDNKCLNNMDAESFSISSEDRDLLDGGIREGGFDVYAFYKSYRHVKARPYPGRWGIFYLKHGVSRVRELIELTYGASLGYKSSLQLAYEFLREHEYFHFKFDICAFSLEAISGHALYEPLKLAFRHHRIHQVEESLANNDVWKWANRSDIGLGEFASAFMKLQPGAYARFDEYRDNLVYELAANLIDLNLSSTARRVDFLIGNLSNELDPVGELCPAYFVSPSSLTAWINPAWSIPKVKQVRESRSFSKSLRSRYRTLIRPWEATKEMLVKNSASLGLNFRPWDKSIGLWSVRINDNFRVHLSRISESDGTWEAKEFGNHKDMGHG